MSKSPGFEVDLASYPEYEELVAEIRIEDSLTIVISREPHDEDFQVTFFMTPPIHLASPSNSHPDDRGRLRLALVLDAIEQGRRALGGT